MLSQICDYLNNWFEQRRIFGNFTIENGVIDVSDRIQTNQYYRIVGSIFNDGVHKKGSEELIDEEFNGGVWLMALPKDLVTLATEIEIWQSQYGGADSQNMSPYQSESFRGYSYSKGTNSSTSKSSVPTWQSVYADRLARWKKI